MSVSISRLTTSKDVWEYGNRRLTGLAGQPRTDLIGADESLDDHGYTTARIGNLDAPVSTRALETGGRLEQIPIYASPEEHAVAMTGAELTLFEVSGESPAEVEAWVDLAVMQAGDTIIVRYYRVIQEGGSYRKYAEETYADAQTLPALCILNKRVYRGTRVTAEQLAGVHRTLPVQVLRQS